MLPLHNCFWFGAAYNGFPRRQIAPTGALKNSLNTKGNGGRGFFFSFDCFSLFRLCFFAVICYLSTLQQTVASSHELMKLLQQLLPPVRLRLGTRTRTFRKRFLNNFPGGCLTNFTGAVSATILILDPSALCVYPCHLLLWQCLPCLLARKQETRSQKSTMKMLAFYFISATCELYIYVEPSVPIQAYIYIYIYIDIWADSAAMLGTPWEMTLPSATYLICASNSCDKLAAQLHKMCPPFPLPFPPIAHPPPFPLPVCIHWKNVLAKLSACLLLFMLQLFGNQLRSFSWTQAIN